MTRSHPKRLSIRSLRLSFGSLVFGLFFFSLNPQSGYAKVGKGSVPAKAKSKEKVKSPTSVDRWTYLLKLIEEEEKTINMVKRKSDHLMYRLFELKNERIKLYKEKENKRFVDLSAKGKKLSRKSAFKKTLAQYAASRAYGQKILKWYPNTRYKSAIYHSLALNSRDYAYDKRELGYLYKAIENTRKHSDIWYLAMTSLAEYFYNAKKYKRAVGLYDQIIHNDEDQWHTKNLYNYGWCLLKTHKFKKAVNTLEKGYLLSFETKYIDFRDQIMHSLVSFYVLSKDIDRGIAFILKHDKTPYEALFRFANKTSGKGFFAETEKLIELAEDRLDVAPASDTEEEKKLAKAKEAERLGDIRLFQFDFYNQYKREAKIFAAARDLSKITLTDYQREEATRKISDKARVEQMIIKKDFDKVAQAYDVGRLKSLESYFDFLSILDKKNEAMYRFFTAETLYSVKEYTRSLEKYKLSLEIQLKTPSKMDLNRKIIDGIFSSIDFSKLSKKREMEELEYAYLKYLQLWPTDEKARSVHQKLFAIYFARKDHANMQVALDLYVKNFPKDNEVHQKLFRQRIDLSIKEENTLRLASLVRKMQQGYLAFSKVETKKSEVILANLLFSKFQKLNKEGDTKGAIAGYQEVFYNKNYPQSVIAEAGFNIGILYTDLYEAAKSVKWFKRTFPLFTEKEKVQKRDFIEKMSTRSALLQDFLNAAHMQRIVLESFCHTKKKNGDNLRQAIVFDLANDYVLKAEHTYKTYKHCVADTKDTEHAFIKHLFQSGHERSLRNYVTKYKLANKHRDILIDYYERLYWKHFDDQAKRSLYRHEMKNLNDIHLSATLAGVEQLERYTEVFEKFKARPINMEKFDPNKFNQQLNARATQLASMIGDAKKLLEIQNAQLSIMVYDQVFLALKAFASEIQTYRPQGMPEEFNKQFLPQMKMLAGTFEKKAYAHAQDSAQLADKYEILISKPAVAHAGSNVLELVDIRMPASLMANTFDLKEKK